MLPFYPLKRLIARFGFTAVIAPILVVDKAKSGDVVLWPDLDLTRDLLSFFFNILTK